MSRAIEKLIGEQFRGKDALIKPNLHALHLGRDWQRGELDCPIGLRARKLATRSVIGYSPSGNDAAALGAVYGGATVCAWYPITPSSSLAEAFARIARLRRDPETKKNTSRSCRPRTNWPRSAW